jgi:hypothetical protein
MKKLFLISFCVPFLGISQVNDFVSDLDLGNIYNNQISIDFVVLGIYGNELYEHYESCRLKNLSLYSYDTIWNIHHLGEIPKNQKDPRIAFLNNDNFHLMDFEIWDPNKKDFIIGPYKADISGYDYYLGNGFALSEMNELLDFNADGYLDTKVKYTKLDYEASHHLTRGISMSIFSEYQKKIKSGELNKGVDFNDYEKEEWKLNNNFGYWGYGYITKYSAKGFLYFFIED